MPRAKTHIQRTAFSAGLNTESNPLNQVPDSCQSLVNSVIERTGDLRRRRGITRETGYAETDTGIQADSLGGNRSSVAIQEFFWENPGGDITKDFCVVQTGNSIRFYDTANTNPSANLVGTVTLDSAALTGSIPGAEPMSFAAVNGHLIVASRELSNPLYIKYSKDNIQFIVGRITLKVRDVWGVDDQLSVDEKPAELTDPHLYNLYNQGWGDIETEKDTATVEASGNLIHPYYDYIAGKAQNSTPINQVFAERGTYPSNAEIENLWSTDSDEIVRTNSTPAPRGRFVIDAFNRGANRADLAGLSLISTGLAMKRDLENGRISQVAAFGDRVFYSGILSNLVAADTRSPNYSNVVFFSRQIRNDTDLGVCYQEADPTSEDFSDLVATDGGFIALTEANNILGMRQFGGSLLVFADNGVWGITGPDKAFRANDYSVVQITRTGALSNSSIVAAQQAVFWWSSEGIFSVVSKDITDKPVAESLTQQTIQTFYNAIPTISKLYSKGIFDPIDQRVRWLYNDTSVYDGVGDRWRYNKELVFDLNLPAFYPNDFTDAWVLGYVRTSPYTTALDTQNVVDDGDNVVNLGDQVIDTVSSRSSGLSQTKYLIEGYSSSVASGDTVPETLMTTFGVLSNTSFLDWVDNPYSSQGIAGVDAQATGISFWMSSGDVTRKKNIDYMHMFFRRTETSVDALGNPVNPSGCQVRVRWDFSDSSSSGKWSPFRQMYRYKRMYIDDGSGDLDYGHSVLVTKNRVRGSGKVLAIEFNSEAGKDMHMHGWSISLLGNEAE